MFIELLLYNRCYASGGGGEEMPPQGQHIKVAFQCYNYIYCQKSKKKSGSSFLN